MLIVNFFSEMLFQPTSSLALADVYMCHSVCVCDLLPPGFQASPQLPTTAGRPGSHDERDHGGYRRGQKIT